MNADGSGKSMIRGTSADDWAPAASPDGSKIIFTSNQSGNYDVYSMGSEGSDVTDLTPGTPSSDYSDAWADGGRYVLFDSNRSKTGGNFLYYMRPDGSDVHLALII